MLRLNDQELSDLIAKLEAERVPDPKNDQEFFNLILKVDDELYEEGLHYGDGDTSGIRTDNSRSIPPEGQRLHR